MASEQVMLTRITRLLLVTIVAAASGCAGYGPDAAPVARLVAPYDTRQVWAVAPLRNESGSLQVDGVVVADHLARQLERAAGIDVIPVNRVLTAMEALRMPAVASPKDALKLRRTLGVDALVVGTVSAYDPYDPPKLGLAVELYTAPRRQGGETFNLRELTRAPTDTLSHAPTPTAKPGQPITVLSGYYDAADPATRTHLQRYAAARGPEGIGPTAGDWRRFRISMDLYTEFVSYRVSSRLLDAEDRRLERESPKEPAS